MEKIVEEFERRTGKRLKEREKGVMGELMQKELLNMLRDNLRISTRTEKLEDLDGIPMGTRKTLVLSLGKDAISSVPVSDVGLRY
jgi:hypothetical protein